MHFSPHPIGLGGILHWWPLSVCLSDSVCLSVCPMPDPKSRMEGRNKLKIGKKEAHDTSDLWPHLEIERSKVKVIRSQVKTASVSKWDWSWWRQWTNKFTNVCAKCHVEDHTNSLHKYIYMYFSSKFKVFSKLWKLDINSVISCTFRIQKKYLYVNTCWGRGISCWPHYRPHSFFFLTSWCDTWYMLCIMWTVIRASETTTYLEFWLCFAC